MEPDLMLHPILERAVPSLEALVETQRTIAVIKGLNAIAPAIVSRDVYYPGAKHLVAILQLLIPGIDLNDPGKTLCTTAFLVEISQFIKFSDLTTGEEPHPPPRDTEPTLPVTNAGTLPSFSLDDVDGHYTDFESRLSDEEEDALLKDSTGNFPGWVASFVRRVIQLLENLPDEGPDGSAGGASEIQLVDAVTGACSQICVHLSEPLYDLVLNMIFDYASTNVRSNAVRAIHQLVECVANADPVKTLAKFFSFCARNIQVELENGASSLRTTSVSSPLPSDATLHWMTVDLYVPLLFYTSMISQGLVQLLRYKDELISLFKLLHNKTYSKRGYSWSGKLLHLSFVRNAFSGIPTLFQQKITPEEAASATETTDILCVAIRLVLDGYSFAPRNEIPELIASMDNIASGFCLTDPEDPQYRYMTLLRDRFGRFLHKASVSLRQQGAENTVDAVDMLVCKFPRYASSSVLRMVRFELYGPIYSNMEIAGTEPTLSPALIKSLLGCQHNEKPNYLVYDISTPHVDKAVRELRAILSLGNDPEATNLVVRAREQRISRLQLLNNAAQTNISTIMEVGDSEWIHWRYEIVATRALRTLVRRDVPTSPDHLQYFLNRVCDDHPTIRYYSQRAVTKIARNIKLRTFCTTPTDLVLMRIRNPLKMKTVIAPLHNLAAQALAAYRKPFDYRQDIRTPLFLDQDPPGWVAFDDSVAMYLPPSPTKSALAPWDSTSKETLETLRETVTEPEFWEEIAEHYAEENHETTITQDNASFVKSIWLVQLLEDEPLEALRPTLEKLIQNKDQNKQRAAAEFVAGILGGSKHWATNKQEGIWNWFKPYLKQIFIQNVKTDTLMIWTTFFEYIFYHTDPRRVQPLVDFIVTEFKNIDYNAEMTFDGVKVLSLFRAFYEEMGRKFDAWAEDTLARTWAEISSEHDDLRAYIGEILAFTQKIKWTPRPTLPTTEVFVKECRVVPKEFDIMGMRGVYHRERVLELVARFETWRDERLPGVRAFQSTYDRCVHDNTELSNRASTLLVRMCGVTPPLPMVGPLLDGIFDAIRSSPSWRIRLKALPLVQVFYFRQVPLIDEIKIVEILEVLCSCLDDEVVEVREMAATTLSGILRLSPRRSVLTLKDRFARLAKNSHIPARQDPNYNKAIRQRHAAILGICALVDSYPYTVEKWMPALLTNVLAEHTYDPIPISTTVRKCASNFKRTHQDTWHEDSKRFDEDQLAALSTLLTGSSYYA
ncbi:hypothetical protein H0H87_005840 [Tephrocybe sp. NHM501043]|nr:hypothetical protein H0H87_005840 [Tephrocybe sp. NHM501043]